MQKVLFLVGQNEKVASLGQMKTTLNLHFYDFEIPFYLLFYLLFLCFNYLENLVFQ